MIRTTMLAVSALLLAPLPAAAQSQADLDSRYDRALAAGYKAMFLCSAIANAERNGATRTPESVMAWELTGIQSPLNDIVGELPYEIVRGARIQFGTPTEGFIRHVAVEWENDFAPRVAINTGTDGCKIMPLGFDPDTLEDATDAFRTKAPVVPPVILRENARLESLVPAAFGPIYGEDSRTTAVSVFADNNIQSEMFADGFTRNTPQRTWSVAKSVAATFIGMAVFDDAADVNTSAHLGEGPDDPRRAITIDNLMRMTSGRYSDTAGNRTDPLYFGGATVDERAANWPLLFQPNTIFRYANNDTLMAVEAIQPWIQERRASSLLEQLGMSDATVETDWQGNFVLSSQVWASTSDFLSLGELYLRDGVSRFGERRLPEGWTRYVSTPAGPQPGGSRGWGYGAGWWLLNNSEGVPADTILAAGNRGQYIVVVPSLDVVIVRRGEDPAGGSGFDIAGFTRDVLAALDD